MKKSTPNKEFDENISDNQNQGNVPILLGSKRTKIEGGDLKQIVELIEIAFKKSKRKIKKLSREQLKLLKKTISKKLNQIKNYERDRVRVGQRRIDDIDSNKKLLRTRVWNYLEKIIYELTDIKNIKPKNDQIKNHTKKEFEQAMFNDKIQNLYMTHYGLTDVQIISHIKDEKTKEMIILALSKTFKEYFLEYRNSDAFFIDLIKKCKDKQKLQSYFDLAKSYLDYLSKGKKTSLSELKDDEGLPKDFIQKFIEIISKLNSESNILTTANTKNNEDCQCEPLSDFSSCPKNNIEEMNLGSISYSEKEEKMMSHEDEQKSVQGNQDVLNIYIIEEKQNIDYLISVGNEKNDYNSNIGCEDLEINRDSFFRL